MIVNEDNTISSVKNRLPHVKITTDNNGYEKQVYEVYTTKCSFCGIEYDLLNKRTYSKNNK